MGMVSRWIDGRSAIVMYYTSYEVLFTRIYRGFIATRLQSAILRVINGGSWVCLSGQHSPRPPAFGKTVHRSYVDASCCTLPAIDLSVWRRGRDLETTAYILYLCFSFIIPHLPFPLVAFLLQRVILHELPASATQLETTTWPLAAWGGPRLHFLPRLPASTLILLDTAWTHL